MTPPSVRSNSVATSSGRLSRMLRSVVPLHLLRDLKLYIDRTMVDRGRSKDDATLPRIPVFVFPANILFNALERDHLKQILTVYNPYEFPIRFKVLSNALPCYIVIPSDGIISSKNSLDLIARIAPEMRLESGTPLKNRLRIQMYETEGKKPLGHRDIECIIHFGNLPAQAKESDGSSPGGSSEGFQQFPSGSMGSSKDSASTPGSNSPMAIFPHTHSQPNYVVLAVAIVCIIGLVLPYSNENCKSNDASNSSHLETILPSYLHLSVNQKLLFAYALGLVTMVVLRP